MARMPWGSGDCCVSEVKSRRSLLEAPLQENTPSPQLERLLSMLLRPGLRMVFMSHESCAAPSLPPLPHTHTCLWPTPSSQLKQQLSFRPDLCQVLLSVPPLSPPHLECLLPPAQAAAAAAPRPASGADERNCGRGQVQRLLWGMPGRRWAYGESDGQRGRESEGWVSRGGESRGGRSLKAED